MFLFAARLSDFPWFNNFDYNYFVLNCFPNFDLLEVTIGFRTLLVFRWLTQQFQCRSAVRRDTTRSDGLLHGAAGGARETGPRSPPLPGSPPSWMRCWDGRPYQPARPAASTGPSPQPPPASVTPATLATRTMPVSSQVTPRDTPGPATSWWHCDNHHHALSYISRSSRLHVLRFVSIRCFMFITIRFIASRPFGQVCFDTKQFPANRNVLLELLSC